MSCVPGHLAFASAAQRPADHVRRRVPPHDGTGLDLEALLCGGGRDDEVEVADGEGIEGLVRGLMQEAARDVEEGAAARVSGLLRRAAGY